MAANSLAPRVLVTGATGLLGRAVLKAFENDKNWNALGLGFSRADGTRVRKCDIQDEQAVTAVFVEFRPSLVIHSAADRQPDSCTKNPEAARKLNVHSTSSLAKLCEQHEAVMIYISTDYVFPGKEGDAPYAATAKPAPTNIYGQLKLDGEDAVLKEMPSHRGIILRVPVLYGETEPKDNYKESAVNVLMDALLRSQEKEVIMDDYAIRYPTNVVDVARVLVDIGKKLNTTKDEGKVPQIMQFSSEDRMTKYEISKLFGEIMDLPIDNVKADAESGKKPAADGTLRPYDCHLSTRELKDFGIDVSTVNFRDWWKRYMGAYRR